MPYDIVFAPGAVKALQDLPAYRRAQTRDAVEKHLRHEPTRVSKSRIKRLRGLEQPQYRLRVEDIRVFYDVTGQTVEVLAIIPKAQAQKWLTEHATGPQSGDV